MNAAAMALALAGLTDYDDGVGWWLGHDGTTPKFSIGNSGGNKLTWDGTNLELNGNVLGASETGTDSGTLSGFTDTVNLEWDYQRTGNIVTLRLSGLSALGTSNSTSMVYSTLAAGLRPASQRRVPVYWVVDGATPLLGLASVNSDGTIQFLRSAFSSGAPDGEGVTFVAFASSGVKGVGGGCELTYAL